MIKNATAKIKNAKRIFWRAGEMPIGQLRQQTRLDELREQFLLLPRSPTKINKPSPAEYQQQPKDI